MLELPGRIGFGMNIGNLLEFQGTFEGNRVVDSASHEENMVGGQIAVGHKLKLLLIGKQSLNLIGQIPQG